MPAQPQARDIPSTLAGKVQFRKPWRNHALPAQHTAPRRYSRRHDLDQSGKQRPSVYAAQLASQVKEVKRKLKVVTTEVVSASHAAFLCRM